MAKHVCPWWLGYLLASPLRRLLQDPAAIITPFVRDGMTVLEPGPGMGDETTLTRPWSGQGRSRDPSTPQGLSLREDRASLRMTGWSVESQAEAHSA